MGNCFTTSYRLFRTFADALPDDSFTSLPGADGDILSLAQQTDGKTLVGGSFTTFHGEAHFGLVRLLGSVSASTTPTPSATPTPGPCSYTIAESTGASIVPGGATRVDVAGNDVLTAIQLPFTWQFYDRSCTFVKAGSNGDVQFVGNASLYNTHKLPTNVLSYAILPHWQEMNTSQGTGRGIFTSVSGSAPNRIFNIRPRRDGRGAIRRASRAGDPLAAPRASALTLVATRGYFRTP